MSTTVTIHEAQYVDPRGGHDKFYRTVAAGPQWIAQYGRNGTLGTVTKVNTAADREAAVAAAAKQMAGKIRKGYEPTGYAVVDVHAVFDLTDPSFLASLAEQNCLTPDGVDVPVEPAPTPSVVAGQSTLTDITAAVAMLLGTGSAATAQDTDPVLPVRPMLASDVLPAQVETMLQDHDMLGQLKYDGDRVVVEVRDGAVTVLGRQGQAKTRGIGSPHTAPFAALGAGRWVFDGEVVGGVLVLFDLAIASDGTTTWVDERTPFERRHEVLATLVTALSLGREGAIVLAPVHDPRLEPGSTRRLLEATRADGREGIILRARAGAYEHGRRSPDLVRVKNVKDADVFVIALDPQRDSAELGVHDAEGTMICVGAASTIGKGIVDPGEVWTVAYLNVNDPDHPRLYQPRLVRRRTDKAPSECIIDQFAHAGANRSI